VHQPVAYLLPVAKMLISIVKLSIQEGKEPVKGVVNVKYFIMCINSRHLNEIHTTQLLVIVLDSY
jgi:hypothetical protein